MSKISRIGKTEADAIDASLGLKAISVRVPIRLIADLKLIAKFRCIAYQALLRDALSIYVGREMRAVRKELAEYQGAREEILERLSIAGQVKP